MIKELRTISNETGNLTFYQLNEDIDFPITRQYYIYGVNKGEKRGFHAHKHLKQLLFCPYGSITILLFDGYEWKEVVLDKPNIALILYPCLWREMVWNIDNSVLCVSASEMYDEDDYIRDFDQFIKYMAEKRNNG